MMHLMQAAQAGKLVQKPTSTPSLTKEKVCQCIDANIAIFQNPET